MASHGVDDSSMDEALFEFFKKQVCFLYFCLLFFNSVFDIYFFFAEDKGIEKPA